MDNLPEGIYEKVISDALSIAIDDIDRSRFIVDTRKIDSSESESILSHYMQNALEYGLKVIKEKAGKDNGVKNEIMACNILLDKLHELANDDLLTKWKIGKDGEELLSIWDKTIEKKRRPISSISVSSIFTGSKKDPSLALELKNEIETSDSIDFLVSFIKYSGLIRLLKSLEDFTRSGKKLRVITTTYTKATDAVAIEKLAELPNTTIKISYDTRTTRLHAKSYIFHRDNGFTTAFVGSSNLSAAAITDGTEWNIKITNSDMPQVIEGINAAFDSYWNSEDFEEYDLTQKERLRKALVRDDDRDVQITDISLFDVNPFPFQQGILNDLRAERNIHKSNRNLVVAATGTGKTVVSAFDYRNFITENPDKRKFLYIVHREEILRKSLTTYRVVLKDKNFGDLATGNHEPDSYERVFMTIQTLESKRLYDLVEPDYYDYIVVDEVHHGAAASYQKLLTYFNPKIMLGLTATPERSDGLDILKYFNDRIASEIRLHEAIDRELLVPFQYFAVTDEADLSNIKFTRGQFNESELEELYLRDDNRVKTIYDSLMKYFPNINKLCGLGFCVSMKHAEYMAHEFNELGIESDFLTSKSDYNKRKTVPEKLSRHEIKMIFTVDLYNEGVDIPEVNLELMLRPTESLTVFIQQLGRGLRISKGKDVLTVLDFVGQFEAKYNMYEKKLKYMGQSKEKDIKKQIEDGFTDLPLGCFIEIEKVAKERILNNIKKYADNKTRLTQLVKESGLTNLIDFIKYNDMKPDDIYSKGTTFTGLLDSSGLIKGNFTKDENEKMSKIFRRLSDIDGYQWISCILKCLQGDYDDNEDKIMMTMLYYTFYPDGSNYGSLGEFVDSVRNSPFAREIRDLLQYNRNKIKTIPVEVSLGYKSPFEMHCRYTRSQIKAGFGMSTFEKNDSWREGVRFIKEKNTHILTVDLNKSEHEFSPTTLYKDYAISKNKFHWQSQSGTSRTTDTGKSYINHVANGCSVLLFVRLKNVVNGKREPFTYLGKATFESCEGDKPISIIWDMEEEIPLWILEQSSAIRI